MDIPETLAYLDLTSRVEGFISTFYYADWKGAYARAGIVGLVEELFSSLVGFNYWKIWILRDSNWSGHAIEEFLARYGVRVWGRGFIGNKIYFRVKRRQARWAEYLLLRRGVPLVNAVFDSRNPKYAERHAPGSEPRQRERSSSPNFVEALLSLFR